ncbi:MAG: SDR family NAD(P)-dependent oxidoreductase [Betaproteobacteria bacterium]|nr:SDR family NAD(P)-dependent oxidoreductase [Betaproteobacteria bacterium]
MSRPVILITGCSSGIGRCCAEGMLKRGWHVVASARREADVEMLRAAGFDAIQLDMSCSTSIAAAVTALQALTGGRVDAVFLNAGYGQSGAVERLTRVALREQFEANVFGNVELLTVLIPLMRGARRGRIVFNSSVLGRVAIRDHGAYVASKYAVEAFADTLRLELRGSGIRVALIEPGPIESRFQANAAAARAQLEGRSRVVREKRYPFTLGPEAVLRKLVHACEAHNPRARYPVTLPSHLIGILRRVLPTRVMDLILARIG